MQLLCFILDEISVISIPLLVAFHSLVSFEVVFLSIPASLCDWQRVCRQEHSYVCVCVCVVMLVRFVDFVLCEINDVS